MLTLQAVKALQGGIGLQNSSPGPAEKKRSCITRQPI
jgi:hypothetical protein